MKVWINKWGFKWSDEIVGAEGRRQLPKRCAFEFDVYGISYEQARMIESKVRSVVEDHVRQLDRLTGNR